MYQINYLFPASSAIYSAHLQHRMGHNRCTADQQTLCSNDRRELQAVGAEIMADKILVVDDESTTRELLHAFLTSQGYEVILAPSGVEAFELAKSESPNAILLDWKMPGINGLEVCRRLRAEEKTRYIPIIIITGFGTTKKKATDAGADDLIDKPFRLTELAVRVKSVLRTGHITDPSARLMAYMDELDKNRQK
jgi:DNA-binding response OmpR family regulator